MTFSGFASFETELPVILLAPGTNPILVDVHCGFHAYLDKYKSAVWEFYKPGAWVPHCTLCLDLRSAPV